MPDEAKGPGKRLVQVEPATPQDCKLAGKVRGAKLWAGDLRTDRLEKSRRGSGSEPHNRHGGHFVARRAAGGRAAKTAIKGLGGTIPRAIDWQMSLQPTWSDRTKTVSAKGPRPSWGRFFSQRGPGRNGLDPLTALPNCLVTLQSLADLGKGLKLRSDRSAGKVLAIAELKARRTIRPVPKQSMEYAK